MRYNEPQPIMRAKGERKAKRRIIRLVGQLDQGEGLEKKGRNQLTV